MGQIWYHRVKMQKVMWGFPSNSMANILVEKTLTVQSESNSPISIFVIVEGKQLSGTPNVVIVIVNMLTVLLVVL